CKIPHIKVLRLSRFLPASIIVAINRLPGRASPAAEPQIEIIESARLAGRLHRERPAQNL
ncbi:MAG: hypothetical protein FWD68_20980, partial [Alphaproteobacteria bacterium]|nr:hypothetical protein [Alphaproteobacteria bacterium]